MKVSMPITITSRIVSDVVILDLSGRFSPADVAFRQVVRERLEDGRQHFLLNLAQVPYIGTWAISQMISIWTSIRARNGTMGLVAPTKTVRDVLQITRLSSIFPLYENEQDALKDLGK